MDDLALTSSWTARQRETARDTQHTCGWIGRADDVCIAAVFCLSCSTCSVPVQLSPDIPTSIRSIDSRRQHLGSAAVQCNADRHADMQIQRLSVAKCNHERRLLCMVVHQLVQVIACAFGQCRASSFFVRKLYWTGLMKMKEALATLEVVYLSCRRNKSYDRHASFISAAKCREACVTASHRGRAAFISGASREARMDSL